jgi:hypothetical protein
MQKSFPIAVLLIVAATTAANASQWSTMYHDDRRTGGHARSDAAFKRDMKFCARQVGLPFNNRAGDLAIDQPDPPAFKECMLTRGLRWQWTRRNHAAPASVEVGSSSYEPPADTASPPPAIEPPPMVSAPMPSIDPNDPAVNPGVFMHRDDQPAN